MKFRVYATLAALLVGVSLASAQGTTAKKASEKAMSATGVVTSVSGASLAIAGKDKSAMTFTVDSSTKVLKKGATAKTKEKQAAGAKGLVITDVVHSGDSVTVRYMKSGTSMMATEVRVR